jgi:hypothetical protein
VFEQLNGTPLHLTVMARPGHRAIGYTLMLAFARMPPSQTRCDPVT